MHRGKRKGYESVTFFKSSSLIVDKVYTQSVHRSNNSTSNYGDLKRRLDEIIKKIDSTLEPAPEKRS